MKALLVTDTNLAIDNISRVLETAGYDVIVYKWLLKALDNIEEIAPHLIIISTKDYPRHWKTLTQFACTDFGGYKPQVILYAEGGLSEQETKKANILKVRGIFESVDVEGLDQLRKILAKEIDIYSGKLLDEAGHPLDIPIADAHIEEKKENELTEIPTENNNSSIYCSFIFTNPLSGAIVSGYSNNYDGKSLTFNPDLIDLTKNLSAGTKIDFATIKKDNEYEYVNAVVKSNEDKLVLELC